jgi:hypothetical protein
MVYVSTDRFDVSMDDAVLVQIDQSIGDVFKLC